MAQPGLVWMEPLETRGRPDCGPWAPAGAGDREAEGGGRGGPRCPGRGKGKEGVGAHGTERGTEQPAAEGTPLTTWPRCGGVRRTARPGTQGHRDRCPFCALSAARVTVSGRVLGET